MAELDERPEPVAALGEPRIGRYLREVSAPRVDTKFAEWHRGVLAGILGVSASASGFLADLGLRAKPETHPAARVAGPRAAGAVERDRGPQ